MLDLHHLTGKRQNVQFSHKENKEYNKGAGWKPGDWHDDSPPDDNLHEIALQPPLSSLYDEHE